MDILHGGTMIRLIVDDTKPQPQSDEDMSNFIIRTPYLEAIATEYSKAFLHWVILPRLVEADDDGLYIYGMIMNRNFRADLKIYGTRYESIVSRNEAYDILKEKSYTWITNWMENDITLLPNLRSKKILIDRFNKMKIMNIMNFVHASIFLKHNPYDYFDVILESESGLALYVNHDVFRIVIIDNIRFEKWIRKEGKMKILMLRIYSNNTRIPTNEKKYIYGYHLNYDASKELEYYDTYFNNVKTLYVNLEKLGSYIKSRKGKTLFKKYLYEAFMKKDAYYMLRHVLYLIGYTRIAGDQALLHNVTRLENKDYDKEGYSGIISIKNDIIRMYRDTGPLYDVFITLLQYGQVMIDDRKVEKAKTIYDTLGMTINTILVTMYKRKTTIFSRFQSMDELKEMYHSYKMKEYKRLLWHDEQKRKEDPGLMVDE